jgi:uncharacterized repeat protein (TIGR03943 family)
MSTDAGATLTAVIGVVLTRLSLQGTFRRYVRPGMGVWLAIAGVLLTLLGIIVLWRHRRGQDDHSAHELPGHEHGGEKVAWLLLAPILALLLIAPGALGSFALGRTGSAVSVRGGGAVFSKLDAAAGPHEMSLLEYDQRAFDGTTGSSFNGAPVKLIGFVGPKKDEGFVLARYSIACCAADALAATAHVVGWTGPEPERDSWVTVEGTFEPGDEKDPRLVATSVTPIPEPGDPYE